MTDSLASVRFGQTDLMVSPYCQGTAFRTMDRSAANAKGEQVLRHCLDVGLNFFDSSYAYGWGGSETLLGKVLSGRRESAVICTKVPAMGAPETEGGRGALGTFTGGHLRSMLDDALERLCTDYVDLFLLHHPDNVTGPQEICQAMDELVQSGKTRYWGVSNHSGDQVRKLCQAATESGTSLPAAIENYHTLAGQIDDAGRSMVRQIEGLMPVVREHGIGVISFSPMDRGALAPQNPPEPGSPLERLVTVLDDVAAELGVLRSQVSVAWTLAHPEVSSVLGGAECTEHVDEMVAGAALLLPKELKVRLDQASAEYRRQTETHTA